MLQNKIKRMEGISQQEFDRRIALHDQFQKEVVSMMGKSIHVITFQFQNSHFAIEIENIEEVVVTPPITPVPKTPPYVKGIGKIRGQNVIIIDLAAKLGIQSEDTATYTIVIHSERFVAGILVHEVPGNVKVPGDSINPTGMNITGTAQDETYIKGLIEHNDSHMFLIDIDELIEGDRIERRITPEIA